MQATRLLQPFVIDTILFWLERLEFFVPVCKPVLEYPMFHLELDFGPFRAIPDNFGRDGNSGRYKIYPVIKIKKKKRRSKGRNDAGPPFA